MEAAQNRKMINFYRRRNTPTYTFMAWSAFILASGFEFIGIYNLKQPLSVQGYYAVTGILLIITSFLLQKVARDNDEDKFLRDQNPTYRSRNTSSFTFMAWGGFLLAILAEYVGLLYAAGTVLRKRVLCNRRRISYRSLSGTAKNDS